MPEVPIYNPRVFDAPDVQTAKRIILSPHRGGQSTDERWERETPHLIALMSDMGLDSNSVVLDFGCGIGRMSKAMIEAFGCRVVGVEISRSMVAFLRGYVNSERFRLFDPSQPACTAAIAVWVLQHVANLKAEVARLAENIVPSGLLFVVNESYRAVPTDQGWVHDHKDVKVYLAAHFDLVTEGKLDPAVVGQDPSERSFWAIYRKR